MAQTEFFSHMTDHMIRDYMTLDHMMHHMARDHMTDHMTRDHVMDHMIPWSSHLSPSPSTLTHHHYTTSHTVAQRNGRLAQPSGEVFLLPSPSPQRETSVLSWKRQQGRKLSNCIPHLLLLLLYLFLISPTLHSTTHPTLNKLSFSVLCNNCFHTQLYC